MSLILKQKSLEPGLPQQWNLADDTTGNVYKVTLNNAVSFEETVPVRFRLIPMHGGSEEWYPAVLSVREHALVLRAPENLLFHHHAHCCEIELTEQAAVEATAKGLFVLSRQLFVGQISRSVTGLNWLEARAIETANLSELNSMVGLLFQTDNGSYYLQPTVRGDAEAKRLPVAVDPEWVDGQHDSGTRMVTVAADELHYLSVTLDHLS